MPFVHFAKFNFNEKIYEIYKNQSKFNELINKIYQEINTTLVLTDEENDEVRFKFIHLDKNSDSMVINGRIIAYSPGVTSEYDPVNDDIIEEEIQRQASYITFSFDLRKEVVGFVPKRDFGRNQFLQRFRLLIERSTDVGEVKLFLETDIDQLTEKLKRLSKVKEINAHLIPPNSDKKLFKELLSFTSSELEETNATKFEMGLKGSMKKTLDVGSKYIQRLIKATNFGYAKILAIGQNRNGEEVRVDSEEDALYRKSIHNNSKDSIPDVAEKTRAGITHLSSLKAERLRLDDKGALNEGERDD